MNGTVHIAKTKALISFAVTAKLICTFVFEYACYCFSHVKGSYVQYSRVNDVYLVAIFLF